MKRNVLASSTALLTSLLLGGPKTGWAAAVPNQQKMMEAYDRLPFGFEANQGQTDERVQFFARGSGYRLFLLRDEAVFVQEKPLDAQLRASASSGQTERATLIHMRFSGASATPQITGFAPLPGKSNYFLGNDPKRWRINVPNYAQVKYAEVYPGIDVVYHGTRGQLQSFASKLAV